MKLLFDENLSRHLVRELAQEFPGSAHVTSLSIRHGSDAAIWSFAGREGFTIVSKDVDFQSLSARYGAPPKVILLRVGNGTTASIARLLRSHREIVEAFGESGDSLLILA